MTKTELLEIIRNGENSGVEFKRDDVHPQSLAKKIASLANLKGGCILLGIEDDALVTGILRPNIIEEWVMNICQDNVQPSITPYFEIIWWEEDKKIGVITIPYTRRPEL